MTSKLPVRLVEWLTAPGRLPLRVLIPANLLLFGVVLGVLSLEHNRREALEVTRTQEREQLVQRLTRMQGALEYLVRRGDHEQLQAVIAALGADPVVESSPVLSNRCIRK